LTYAWVFGDGATSTLANPSHTYQTIGSFSARLTVSDGLKTSTSSNLVISVVDPASTLVAAYGFDEGSGANTGDASGNGNMGVISGASWALAGRFGKALSFTSGALVSVNDSSSLDLSDSITLEAWVYPTTLSGSWMNLIFKPNGDPGSQNPCYVLQGCTPTAQVPSLFVSPAASNLSAPSPLPINTWTHLAATYDGATLRLYVNGIQTASRAQTGTMSSSTDALTIGGNVFSGQNWNGLIDEVRIYNRALGATEIQADMTRPISSAPPKSPSNLRVLQ
jgi:PKD repeat protein